MSSIYLFHFCVFSFCVNIFSILTYISYFTDRLSSSVHYNFAREFDYIIVGSGTAGSLIAHRLATETNHSFILLEAGSYGNFMLEVPVLGPLLHGSPYDWQLETVPQDNACLAMNGNKCKLPQGKIFGGTSKLNNMIYCRGNLSIYLDWFNGKYTEEDIVKEFQYIEKNIIYISELEYESELSNAMMKAAKELNYKKLEDYFEKGFRKSIVSQFFGKRWSTSDNVYEKHVITNALVEKVLINIDKTAYGVKVLLSGKSTKMYAKKGIILSAGTLNTPKILQLSGIGPKELLKPLGIQPIMDLPVGKNLQDHVTTGLDLILFNHSLSINPFQMLSPYNWFTYLTIGTGPLTYPGCEVVGFLSTKGAETPDIQFMVMPIGLSSDRGAILRKNLGIKNSVWDKYFVNIFHLQSGSILPILLHPKSRGDVFIKSTDPKVSQVINPNYLSNKEDKEVLVEGLKLMTKFLNTEAMAKLGAYLNPMKFPGCENYEIFSDIYWDCYITQFTLPSYHPVGTCSMGPSRSSYSVVDTSFKVIGVENLYIVDGSVLPSMPSGNINAAIALMGSLFCDETFGSKNKIDNN